jgi:hypothetical protein
MFACDADSREITPEACAFLLFGPLCLALTSSITWSASQDGWTALDVAATNAHLEAVKALMEAGANLEAKGGRGAQVRGGRVRLKRLHIQTRQLTAPFRCATLAPGWPHATALCRAQRPCGGHWGAVGEGSTCGRHRPGEAGFGQVDGQVNPIPACVRVCSQGEPGHASQPHAALTRAGFIPARPPGPRTGSVKQPGPMQCGARPSCSCCSISTRSAPLHLPVTLHS